MIFVVFRRFHPNRRIRRHTNPRNRHIRCQKSPDSSSNGVFVVKNCRIRRQGFVAKFVVTRTIEIVTLVVKNRRIRRQGSRLVS